MARLTFMSVRDGSYTPLVAAASPDVRKEADKYRGAYLVPIGKFGEIAKQAQEEDRAKELWNTTETLLKEWGL